MGFREIEPGGKQLLIMFSCKDEEEVARVATALAVPLAGIALEGIPVFMVKGEEEHDGSPS